MFKKMKLHYFNAATGEDICLGTIEQDFETMEEVTSYIKDYANDFFWGRPYEDTDSEIYAKNENERVKTLKAKKFFCPSCDEPFDNDRETDVDFNGGMEWI